MEKEEKLRQRMRHLGIFEEDLEEKFVLGAGKGGQKVNKTSSCVYLHHKPTKIEIKCQKSRQRSLNRYYARDLLCDRIEEILFQEKSKKQKEIAKIRRQKKKRSKRAQEKVYQAKKNLSTKKELRKPPSVL